MTETVKPTEPVTPTEPTPTTPAPEVGSDRESPAFRGVVEQLKKEREAREALEARIAAEKDEAENERLKKEQKWGELEAKYKAQIEQITKGAERERLMREIAQSGVTKALHMEFLCDRYLRTENAPPIADWLTAAQGDDEYKPFFGLADPPARQGLPGGDASPGAARSTGGSYTRADLRSADLATRTAAIKWYQDYVNQKGEKPW